MLTYYVSARPETVTAIVTTGKLSETLPSWLKIDNLVCSKTVAACLTTTVTSLHQVFILEVAVPAAENKGETTFALKSLQPEWIKQIFVYSPKSQKLLTKLFNNNCPKPIVLRPEIYPQPSGKDEKKSETESSKTSKEKEEEFTGPPAAKKRRIELPFFAEKSSASKSKETKETKAGKVTLSRLATYDEHIRLLQSAFSQAKKTILITSYSINHDTLQGANLYQLIKSACDRGIRIYIYYNDHQFLDKKIVKFFEDHDIFCEEAYTHSKIVAVDKNLVATGSFNWLSGIDKRYQENTEGSLVFQGEVCESLIEDFWDHIKHYRNQQFANKKLVKAFKRDPDNDSTIIYDLGPKSELAYIPTLNEHCGFLQECFERARQRVIVCSPFISTAKEYEEDIDYDLLKETIARNVDVYFVCAANSPALKDFSAFLAKLNSPKLHLIPIANIHLKTIIIDEDIIAEGSFNWLSATRDDSSDYHNHEQTLYIRGDVARNLIDHFFKSRVGEAILNDICKQIEDKNPPAPLNRRLNKGS